MSDPCPRFAPLQDPPPRPRFGVGATIGIIRPIAIGCAGAAAIGAGVIAAKPPALPEILRPAPHAQGVHGDPIAVPAPGGLLVFGAGVVALLTVRGRRQ